MTAPTKMPVTERALIDRINRRLGEHNKKIHKGRGRHHGQFFITLGPGIIQLFEDNADLEDLARHLGALRDWEEMA